MPSNASDYRPPKRCQSWSDLPAASLAAHFPGDPLAVPASLPKPPPCNVGGWHSPRCSRWLPGGCRSWHPTTSPRPCPSDPRFGTHPPQPHVVQWTPVVRCGQSTAVRRRSATVAGAPNVVSPRIKSPGSSGKCDEQRGSIAQAPGFGDGSRMGHSKKRMLKIDNEQEPWVPGALVKVLTHAHFQTAWL